MTRVHDVFGIHDMTIEDAEAILSRALSVTFEARSSDFLGGDYYTTDWTSEDSVRILDNASALDPEDRPYVGHLDFHVIVEVNDLRDNSNYVAILEAAGFEHLEHSEFDR